MTRKDRPMVTIYTQPDCQPCKATKRWLNNRGIPFTEVDVATSRDDLAAIKSLGYLSAPVVVVAGGPDGDLHWGGFNPTFLTKYTTQFIEKEAA